MEHSDDTTSVAATSAGGGEDLTAATSTATEAPLLHFVEQASEQQVEVQTAAQEDMLLRLAQF